MVLAPVRPASDLAAQAADDLQDDLDELEFIARSQRDRLVRAAVEVRRCGLLSSTLSELDRQIAEMRSRYEGLLEDIAGMQAHLPVRRLAEATAHTRELGDLVRTLQGVSAALMVASEWQSPSFDHSIQPNAGRSVGRVTEHHDDYRRDRHPQAAAYEDLWAHSMVDGGADDLRALLTSCGMSAFGTILRYLAEVGRGPVLLGRSCYHECRQLVVESGLGPVFEVDETDSEGVIRAVAERRPRVVFLDSLCNAATIAVPDLRRILAGLHGNTTVVIDNTGLSATCQPFAMPRDRGVRLIVFESLTKYAQLGMDRVTAGVLVASRGDAESLDGYREHLGTNIPDSTVEALPPPSRGLLERRLARLGRNALLLAEHVERRASGAVEGAIHPALAGHPSHEVAAGLPFAGGFFAIRFRPGADAPVHRRFVDAMMAAARRLGVPLVAGASFGLNTTRVYLTATRSEWGSPFVRIAAGTEHRLEIEGLKQVLSSAIDATGR